LVNLLRSSSLDGQSVLVNDTKDFFVEDGPKCAYELSKNDTTDYPMRFESCIKSNFLIKPIKEMFIIPSRVLIVSKKLNVRAHFASPLYSKRTSASEVGMLAWLPRSALI
jgi:hypothetical protein